MVGGAAHSSENVQTNPIPWVRYAFSLVPSLDRNTRATAAPLSGKM